jgi:ketosteroid isomerase-like protein
MSLENVGIMQRAIEAINRGDLEASVADFAPDFEFVPSGLIPGSESVYRGLEDYRAYGEQLFAEFDDVRYEMHEVVEAGDRVLISLTLRGTGKQSGAETSWSFFHVYAFRDGKVTHGQGFADKQEALKAAGLQE